MKEDWKEIVAELKPWRDTGTYLVAGGSVDDVN